MLRSPRIFILAQVHLTIMPSEYDSGLEVCITKDLAMDRLSTRISPMGRKTMNEIASQKFKLPEGSRPYELIGESRLLRSINTGSSTLTLDEEVYSKDKVATYRLNCDTDKEREDLLNLFEWWTKFGSDFRYI